MAGRWRGGGSGSGAVQAVGGSSWQIYLSPLFRFLGGKRALLTFDHRRAETFVFGRGGLGVAVGKFWGFTCSGSPLSTTTAGRAVMEPGS